MKKIKIKKKKICFHVSLPNFSEKEDYWFQAYGKKHELVLHNKKTRKKARKKHPSLSKKAVKKLTHYTKKRVRIPQGQVTRVHVRKTRRSEGFNDERSAAILASVVNSRWFQKKKSYLATVSDPPPPPPPPPTVDYISTAKAQVFHHYDLITKDEELHDIIYDYMDIDKNEAIYRMIQEAADLMEQMGEPTAGEEGWAKLVEPDYPEDTTEVMTMARDEVQLALADAMTQMMICTKNDPRLEDQKYTVQEGTSIQTNNTGIESGDSLVSMARVEVAETTDDNWNAILKNTLPAHGLETSIKVKGDRQVEISFTNTYLRYLGAYICFYDAENAIASNPIPMSIPDWTIDDGGAASSTADSLNAQYDDLRYMGTIDPIDTIFAVPNYALPGELTVNLTFPEGAVKAEIFGYGLGTGSNAYPRATYIGGVYTGLVNLGVPTFMLAFAVAAQSYKPLYDIMNSNTTKAIVVALGAVYFGDQFAEGAKNKEMNWSAFSSLSQILFAEGMEKGLAWCEEQVVEGELENEIPFAGWIMVAINIATGLAQMAETIAAVASSPWGIKNSIATSITSTIIIKPDPRHQAFPQASAGEMPRCTVNVIYKDNTPTLPLDVATDDALQQLSTQFDNSLGGELKFEVNYYIDSWLAAKATTSFMDNNEENTAQVTLYLVEFPKPIEYDTVFGHTSILSYQNSAYQWWKTGVAPTETKTERDTSNTGNHISEWLGLTLSQRYGMLGFAWRAAGTGLSSCSGSSSDIQLNVFQNIDIPGTPMDHIKYPGCGYLEDVQLIYDSFPPKFKMENGNWVLDENDNPIAADDDNPLGDYYVDPSKAVDYNDPDHAQAALDSDGGYHLRKVNLNNSGNFNTSPGQLSHGRFPYFPNSFALHPSGHMIAVNTEYAKIMILELNQEGTSDDNLPLARTYAGRAMNIQGSQGRPGLLFYPVAVGCSYDGTILILDHISSASDSYSRVQAFDLNGNPVSRFVDETDGSLSPFLHLPDNVTYLDLAVVGDNKLTYLFVLYYEGDGKTTNQYKIAVYKSGEKLEDQSYILTIPNIPSAKITVDMWHTMYTLNFAMVKDENGNVAGPTGTGTGPGGRTVPSVSEWIPSVPSDK